MISYAPPRRKSLGQIEGLIGGMTSGLARQIVEQSEPVVRQIVKEERNQFAEALIGGIPFAVIAAAFYVGTGQLIPKDNKKARAVGFGVSALSAAGGAWWTLSKLAGTPDPVVQKDTTLPAYLDPVLERASNAIIAEAEPKVRAIIDEERARIAEAAQIGLPFLISAIATFLATFFIVPDQNKMMKVAGYTGTALILGAGAWTALERGRGN